MKHNLHGPLKPLKNKIRKQSPTRAQPFAFFFFFFSTTICIPSEDVDTCKHEETKNFPEIIRH
jgi:hypothetical protein